MKKQPVTLANTDFLPFSVLPDGRWCLTGLQMVEQPWLRDFVDRFPDCFYHPINMDAAIFYPNGDAPK